MASQIKRLRMDRVNERTVKAKKFLMKHKDTICKAIEELNTDAVTSFCFLKILNCNGAFPTIFSDAWCKTLRSIEDPEEKNQQIAIFPDLFHTAIIQKILEDSDEIDDSTISDGRLSAISRLVEFLDEIRDVEKIVEAEEMLHDEPAKESRWAAILGTHVLRRLAVNHKMIIDISYPERHTRCPCGCKASVCIGDCSFGNHSVWHGSVDIIIGSVAVAAPRQLTEENTYDEVDKSAFEMKTGNALEHSRSQIFAEAIAFSFTLKKGLIPTVAISKDALKIYMYHPEYDILFEGSELKLFVDKPPLPRLPTQFDIRTIFALWLVMNYDWFCSGVSQDHIQFGYTANFKSHVKDSFEIYKHGMTFGNCRHGTATELPYKAVKGQWQRCSSSSAE